MTKQYRFFYEWKIKMKYKQHLIDAMNAAVQAGEAILEVYETDFDVEIKDDRSPLTLADKKSHEIIKSALSKHGLPSISEEGRSIDYATRSTWQTMWIVDPLDGTKEFVKRNDEFTVNIALADRQSVVMGVIYSPVLDWLYFASVEMGAFKLLEARQKGMFSSKLTDADFTQLLSSAQKLPVAQETNRPYTIVGSRSHGTPELEQFVAQKKEEKGEVIFKPAGSSLKICLVAEGVADVYPRLGPTMEWDTAAGQAIAECSGASMYIYDEKKPLLYNKSELLNPWFVVERDSVE